MRQMRIVYNSEDGKTVYPWHDIIHADQFKIVERATLDWAERDGSKAYFEFRTKPNIFTRVKEWWSNV